MHTYYVRTEAGSANITAETIDAAAAEWARQDCPEAAAAVTDMRSLVAYIESIDNAWLWIESDDAPDGARIYAGLENIP